MSKSCSIVDVPLVAAMLRTVWKTRSVPATWMSKRLLRVLPWYAATRTLVTRRTMPRSYCAHCPSPLADQRVPRLLSTVFAGVLPSFVLAVTAEPGGVTSWDVPQPQAVGVGVGVLIGVV